MRHLARFSFACLTLLFASLGFSGRALAQEVDVTPASFDFGDVVVNDTAGPQLFTLTNTDGAITLNVTTVSLTTGVQFVITTNTCNGASLPPAGTCTFEVEFTPDAATPFSDTVNIVSDDPTGPETVALDGNGVEPIASISPTLLSFGDQVVGTTSAIQTVTVENTGTSDLNVTSVTVTLGTDFAIDNETCTGTPVAPLTTCTIDVEFTPTVTGPLTDDIQIVSDAASSPDQIDLDGTGVQPAVSIAPPSLSFGSIAVGNSSVPQALTVTNSGTSDLNVTAVTMLTGTNFSIDSQTCTAGPVAPAASCTVNVVFSPTAAGLLADTVQITSDAPTSIDTAAVSGTGIQGAIALVSPATLDFGNVGVGLTSPPLTAQLTNTGNEPLAITAPPAIVGNTDFVLVNETCSDAAVLQPGEDCLAEVQYSPNAVGPSVGGTLDFTTDLGTSSVVLAGDGVVGPIASVSPPTLDFGVVGVGNSSSSFSAQLTNTGTTLLTITSAAVITGADLADFAIVNDTCGTGTLQPSQSCLVEVVYSPTAVATDSASLDFDTDGGAPSVALTGDGAEGPVASSSHTTLDFGTVDIGTSSAPQAVRLTNTGSADLNLVTAPVIIGAGLGEYEIVSDTCITDLLEPGEDCTVEIVFTPTAVGAAPPASLEFDTDANDLSVTLTGIGSIFANAVVAPTALAFGNVAVGQTSAPLNLQVTNDGLTPLTFTAAPVLSGLDAAQFAILNDGCGTSTLNAHESCIVQVVYTPTAVAAASASLDIVTDANDPSVPITGTGVDGPLAAASPGTLDFGTLAVGDESDALVAQLTNTGTAPLTVLSIPVITGSADFTIVNNTCDAALILNPSQSCLVEIVYLPSAAGAAAATTLDFDTDANDPTITLTGAGSVGPVASVDNSSLAFGNQAVDTVSEARTVQLTNTGTTPLTVTSIALGGANSADFIILNETCTSASPLPAGTDCLVEVQFAPTAAAASTASLDFVTDGGSPSVSLTGTGIVGPNAVATPPTVDFGNVALGMTAGPLTVQLTNSGTTPLTLSAAPAITGSSDFAIVNTSCDTATPLNPAEDCLVELSYTPSLAGAAPATSLDFTTDGGNPSVDLTGAGVIGPIATVNNTTQAFGNQAVGTSSQARVVQLTNTGTTVLTVSTVVLGGANPGEFQLVNETCTAFGTLGVGETCIAEVLFAPTTAAAAAATLDFTTDGGNPSVALSGTGIDAGLSADTPVFPDTLIDTSSAEQTVTVSNAGGAATANIGQVSLSGADPDAFTITDDNCSFTALAGGSDCTIGITFNPDAVATFNAVLDIPSDASGGPLTVALTGDGVAGSLTVTPTSPFDFGDVPINDPLSAGVQVFTLSNVGVDPSADVTVGTLSLVGDAPDQFAVTQDDCSNTVLSIGTSCDVEVTFAPDAAGLQEAALSIPSNAPGQEVILHEIEGTGVTAELGVAPGSPFDFGDVQVGDQSAPQVFTVTNNDVAPLSIGVISLLGDNPSNFTITEDNCSSTILAAAATCDFQVVFVPNDDVGFTATASIPSNDPASPFSLTLLGTGVAQGLIANPTSLAFGNREVGGSTAAQTVTLSNDGVADVSIESIRIVGTNPDDFEIVLDGCSGQTLAPAGSCQVQAVFSPESTGAKDADLLIVSDDPANRFIAVGLSGTGIAPGEPPQLSFSPTVLDFDSVEPGDLKIQNVTLTNVGAGTLSVASVTVAGANPGPFSADGDCTGANLAAGESCTEAVTFFPTSQDDFNAILAFETNVPEAPAFVVLLGSSVEDGGGCSLAVMAEPRGGRSLVYGLGLLAMALLAVRFRLRRRE